MNVIKKKVESNKYHFIVSSEMFSQQAILYASYKFTDKCFFHFEKNDTEWDISLTLKKISSDYEVLIMEFENELIDQQVRIDTNNQFKEIRELLVKKAFSSIKHP